MVTSEIAKFETQFLDYLKTNHRNLLDDIKTTGQLSAENDKLLGQILDTFLPSSGLKMKA